MPATGTGSHDASGKRVREAEDEGEEDCSAYAMSTTLSWRKLSASTLEIFEEGLACVEEECERDAASRAGRSSVSLHPAGVNGQPAHAGGMLPRASKRAGRAQLDEASAARIFLAKYASAEAMGSKSDLSGRLALQYGVTAKAVRDIWNGRTWKKATQPYWNVQPMHGGVWLLQ